MNRYSKIYILDTNALLNDPEVIHAFSGAEVVIPEVVLRELDQLKRKRTDRRVRYHGRKATRMLFEASRGGRLLDGVTLVNGSLLRVDPGRDFEDAPPELDLSRGDDQILALGACLNRRPAVRVTLVSNDLNLLLRGGSLGLGSYRFEGKLETLHRGKRTFLDQLRDNRLSVSLGSLAVIFAVLSLFLFVTRPKDDLAGLPISDDPAILMALGVSPDLLEDRYRGQLVENPRDLDALVDMGNLLFDQERYLEAVGFYRDALAGEPADADVRTDMGIALLRMGQVREATEAFRQATQRDSTHGLAQYNLGVALASQNHLAEAISALEKAIRLSEAGDSRVPVAGARELIAEMEKSLAQSSGT